MRPVDRLHQNPFMDEIFDIGAVDNGVEGKIELVTLIAGATLGRGRQPDELRFRFAVLIEIVDDPFIARSIRRYAMRLVHDDEVGLRYGIRQHILCPHIGREQDVIILERRPLVGYRELTDRVFFAQRLFELFQQN